jgi:hypothetical protein
MITEANPYAQYKVLPNLAYSILEVLMTSSKAELLWKLLKYNDADAWSKSNLTQDEKAALIYPGGEHQENYNIFLDFTMDDSVYDEKTFLRIYPNSILPQNRTVGICSIDFEVLVHSKINHLSNYTTRVDDIVQVLLETLNGEQIGNMGVLYFDNSRSRDNNISTIGMKPYKGKLIVMSLNIG